MFLFSPLDQFELGILKAIHITVNNWLLGIPITNLSFFLIASLLFVILLFKITYYYKFTKVLLNPIQLFMEKVILFILSPIKENLSLSNLIYFTLLLTGFILIILYYSSLNLYTSLFRSNFNISLDLSLLKIVIIVFSIFSIILSVGFLKAEKINNFEYIVLILFSVFGIVVLVSANDLLITYVFIEIHSLSLYILVSIKKNTLYSAEHNLKYFVLRSLASILLLFGFSSIYGIFGSINFSDLALILSFNSDITPILLFPTLYILVGLLFKLTIVPFHFWDADVYEGSLSSISIIYVAFSIQISIFVIFVNFLIVVYVQLYTYILPFWNYFPIISTLLGFIMAVIRKDFKSIAFLMFTGPILKKVATNKFAVASAAASLGAYLNNPDSYLPFMVSNMYKTYKTGVGLEASFIQTNNTRKQLLVIKSQKVAELQALNLDHARQSVNFQMGYNERHHDSVIRNSDSGNTTQDYVGNSNLKYKTPDSIPLSVTAEDDAPLPLAVTEDVTAKQKKIYFKPDDDFSDIE